MTDQTAQPDSTDSQSAAGGVSRRSLFRAAGVGAAVVGGGGLLEACSSGIKGAASILSTSATRQRSAAPLARPASKEITIGWIHPMTGSLAGFGYPDNWVIQQVMATSQYKNGIKIGGTTYKVNIKSYDTQSSVTMAGTLAKQAIQQRQRGPAARLLHPGDGQRGRVQAETLGTPLICSNVPWESWYVNLGGNPQKPTFKPKYTVMYFLGAEHLASCFMPMWNRIGEQVRQQPQGRRRLPERLRRQRVPRRVPRRRSRSGLHARHVDGVPDGLTNYTSMISQFKSHGDDFFTNVPLPPDFATMWNQALQQDFKPKLATVAKVLLFPTDAYAMGSKVYNIATDSWWVPSLPWHSSLHRARPARSWRTRTPRPASASRTRTSPTTPSSRSRTRRSPRSATRTTRQRSRPPVQGQAARGRRGPDRLHLEQEPRARRGDHPAGWHPVAEGHQVPARGQGRRQHPAAEREDHRRPAADLQ